ncbi:MAG: exodeoxyribonuclease VII large subunit [Syntrophales bacterium]|jgi:exodeoxyribonuclease VII large subunit|nr:exodeoxyribonuclease VII large subunit [Syntrophales bacterium]
MQDVWTVSQLSEHIKALLEARFEAIWVEGEVSNLRRPASGHSYFTLKDDRSQIRAVIFRSAQKLPFDLEDGLHIACRARITVYTPRGDYQLIIDRVEPRGLGALQKAFEQLKAKLQAEGLFDERHKKPLPFLPRRIGVITSPTGAVIRDILQVTGRRFPAVFILIAPVRVQGPEAPPEIIKAIDTLQKQRGVDVIILARGGGSLEDLHPFNTEEVARAVYRSSIPIVSAVGHETDYTITDFVADLRAPTPSAAAEIVVPSREQLCRQIDGSYGRLLHVQRRLAARRRERVAEATGRLKSPDRILNDFRMVLDDHLDKLTLSMNRTIAGRSQDLRYLKTRLAQAGPGDRIENSRMIVAHRQQQLVSGMRSCIKENRHGMDRQWIALQNLSPLVVLQRGYSITRRLPEGTIVKNVAILAAGDHIDIQVALGNIRARVEDVV